MRLTTIAEYEAFVYGLRDAFSSVLSSTLRIIRTGPASGRLVGILTLLAPQYCLPPPFAIYWCAMQMTVSEGSG